MHSGAMLMIVGSSAWMFPYLTPDYSFEDYVYRKDSSGQWNPQSLEDACVESEVTGIWDGYQKNYIVRLRVENNFLFSLKFTVNFV